MTPLVVTFGPGPTTVVADGGPCSLSPAETKIVAALALFHPDSVDAVDLQAFVWGRHPPASARSSLHNHVARIGRRFPSMIRRRTDGYGFSEAVDVQLSDQGDPLSDIGCGDDPTSLPSLGPICPELPSGELVDKRRTEQERLLRAAAAARLDRRLTTDDPISTLPDLRAAAERDEFDERAWFRLAATTAAVFGRDAALSVVDEASRTLASCGLEPGRRLSDLERLVRDGERDLDRLMTDRSRVEHRPERTTIVATELHERADEVLGHIDGEDPAHVRIHGPPRSGRSALVDLLAVRAERAGVSVCNMLGASFDGLPLPVVGRWQPRRRRLLIIDDIDLIGDATRRSLAAMVDAAVRAAATDRLPLLVVSTAVEQSRETAREWEMAYVRATVAHLDGRLAEAEEEITASLDLAAAVGSSRALAVYGSVLLAGRFAEDRVHELAPSIEAIAAEQPLVSAWQAPLALAAAVTGAHARAAELFDRLVADRDELPRECSYTAALVMLGEAAARLGRTERSARALELLEPWAGRWAWTGTCSFGPIDLTLARLAESSGNRQDARRWGASALRSAAAMRSPILADRAARLVLRQC